MELFADIAELEARLGRQLDSTDLDRARAVLEDASALVREEVGYTVWIDADTGVLNESLVPASVRAVVLRAAERAMRNPGGFSAESSGDYSYQRTGVLNESLVPASVRAVVLRAAERAMRNPGGFSAESSGDYSYQRTGVQIGVYLSEAEIRTLRRAVKRTGLWTQPITRGDTYADIVFVVDQYGGDLFPIDMYVEGRNTY